MLRMNTIRTVDIIAFRIDGTTETFDYVATATPTQGSTPGGTVQTFVASLRTGSWPQRLVLITNARTQVQALTASTAQGAAKATMLVGVEVRSSRRTGALDGGGCGQLHP